MPFPAIRYGSPLRSHPLYGGPTVPSVKVVSEVWRYRSSQAAAASISLSGAMPMSSESALPAAPALAHPNKAE